VTITGWWGYTDNQAPAGALVGGIDAATTAVAVTDSSLIGVGHILTVGDERMTVTAKRLTSSGQVLQAPLDAKASSQQVTVQDGAAFTVGEVITLDAERMEIRDIADNTLIVKRAVQGTVLGAHTGSTVYAPRLLTVTRGDYGTTPASATDGTALTRWVPPALVHQLAVAESLNWLLNEQSGYLRTTGGTSGSGGKEPELIALKDLRDQCYTEHGRKTRTRAV
jgi:hypothetical protein